MSLLILNKLEYRLRYVKYPIPNYARAATKSLKQSSVTRLDWSGNYN